jgi:hypothetical protein
MGSGVVVIRRLCLSWGVGGRGGDDVTEVVRKRREDVVNFTAEPE